MSLLQGACSIKSSEEHKLLAILVKADPCAIRVVTVNRVIPAAMVNLVFPTAMAIVLAVAIVVALAVVIFLGVPAMAIAMAVAMPTAIIIAILVV